MSNDSAVTATETEADSIQPERLDRDAMLNVVLVAIVLCLAVLYYWLKLPMVLNSSRPPVTRHPDVRFSSVAVDSEFLVSDDVMNLLGGEEIVGETIESQKNEVRITNVQVVDVLGDERNEILVCDGSGNQVRAHWLEDDEWKSEVLADRMHIPAHATVADIDGDGDRDVIVSELGDIMPSDELVGRVTILEATEDGYRQRVVLQDVRRIADVQAGDLDGDGDLDLAVGVFGYARGGVMWLENVGALSFVEHSIDDRPGVIHVPVADYDGDGDLDIAAVVTQDEEEVWILENTDPGIFVPRMVYFTHNFDAGGGGLVAVDLDQDGDQDFLLSHGDNLEFGHGWPQDYHGCVWLCNNGNLEFEARRIGQFGGTYAAAATDMDRDGDLDVVLVSMSNEFKEPTNPSMVWLENEQEYRSDEMWKQWKLATNPVELITVDVGDLNGDGHDDIVAGQFRIPLSVVPLDQPVTVWLREVDKESTE
ncbi:MAG: VCBS repeat-containing protein [Pirellulales bacterium]|nr:VCBS repeat-containing protein [Pirellulales bacterium]